MKYLQCLCAVFCLHITSLIAQQTEPLCVQEQQAVPAISWNGQPGGIYLPSKGVLNALIVFAQYPDDSLMIDNPEWPKNQPPRLMKEWVDSVWTGAPTSYSMTDYYNQMSMGQFKFIGKARFVVAPRTRAQYIAAGMKRSDIHEELLKKLDSILDFEEFDRWDLEDNFVHIEQPDKIVDLIIVIWRNLNADLPAPLDNNIRQLLEFPGDQTELGNVNQSMFVDNNNRRINMGYGIRSQNGLNEAAGSGPVLTKNYILNPFSSIMQTCLHETGHYLIGGNNYHVGFGCWGMISAYGIRNFTANSFERHRLGWITLNSVDATSQSVNNATLPDYVTSGIAWRYVIDSTTAQYFFIENHQGISRWDTQTGGLTSEHGIYVLRQDTLLAPGGSYSQLRMIPADGCYGWQANRKEINSCCGNKLLPVFKQLAPDRHNGFHDCDFVNFTYTPTGQTEKDHILLIEDANGNTVHSPQFSGDGQDAFRMGYQQVFSPWSNPTSQNKFRTSTGFGFELTGVTATANGDVYTLNFHPQNPVDASPAKIQAFTVTPTQGNAVLSWQANEEPDLKWYKIYRTGVVNLASIPSDNAFQLLVTLNAKNNGSSVTSWTDTTTVPVTTQPNNEGYYYKITAIDSTNKESVRVLTRVYINATISTPPGGSGKRGTQTGEHLVQLSVIPNPSADVFWFTFSLPEAGPVSLQLTGVTGRTIATVVDRILEAGEHTLQFDGSHLSNGIYFYRLTTATGVISGTLSVR